MCLPILKPCGGLSAGNEAAGRQLRQGGVQGPQECQDWAGIRPQISLCLALTGQIASLTASTLGPSRILPALQVKQFAQQWKEYVITLDIQAQKGTFGRDLDENKVGKMNQEQLENLRRLEEEAVRRTIACLASQQSPPANWLLLWPPGFLPLPRQQISMHRNA